MNEPTWRTLEGVQVPFQVHVYRTDDDPRSTTVTIVSVDAESYWRVGVTDEGETVQLGGPSTKMWVTG